MKVKVIISGKVQGVFLRAYIKEKADELGLVGWVRNTKDGRVEAAFEGAKEKVEEMIKWCRKGSPASKVKKVEISLPAGQASRDKVEKACPAPNGAGVEQGEFGIRY